MLQYAAAGAKTIYACDLLEEHFPSLVDLVKQAGYETAVVGVKVDVTKSEDLERLVRQVIAEQGRLDWLVSPSLAWMWREDGEKADLRVMVVPSSPTPESSISNLSVAPPNRTSCVSCLAPYILPFISLLQCLQLIEPRIFIFTSPSKEPSTSTLSGSSTRFNGLLGG